MRLRSARDIGALIRDRRRRRGWDQQTLADRVGVSRLWVSEMENGKRSVQLDLVLGTLAALDVTLDTGDDVGAAPGTRTATSRSAMLIGKLVDDG